MISDRVLMQAEPQLATRHDTTATINPREGKIEEQGTEADRQDKRKRQSPQILRNGPRRAEWDWGFT